MKKLFVILLITIPEKLSKSAILGVFPNHKIIFSMFWKTLGKTKKIHSIKKVMIFVCFGRLYILFTPKNCYESMYVMIDL